MKNPDSPKPPHETLEVQITALLLGELSPADAASVRETIARNPQLQVLQDRLKQTIELVRATSSHADQSASAPGTSTLSSERRENLLQSFKAAPTTPAPKSLRARRELLALAAMMVGLLAVAGVLLSLRKPQQRSKLAAAYSAASPSTRRPFVVRESKRVADPEMLTVKTWDNGRGEVA